MLTKNELANTMQLVTVTMQLIIDEYETLDNDSKVEISKLVNSLSGSVPAIACELLTGVFLSKKARKVMFDTNTDVTNGHASEWFVKSIQCKSVTNKVCVHPQKQLCEALDQVNGDTGHMPRTDDTRGIDTMSDNQDNLWPFPWGPRARLLKTQ